MSRDFKVYCWCPQCSLSVTISPFKQMVQLISIIQTAVLHILIYIWSLPMLSPTLIDRALNMFIPFLFLSFLFLLFYIDIKLKASNPASCYCPFLLFSFFFPLVLSYFFGTQLCVCVCVKLMLLNFTSKLG